MFESLDLENFKKLVYTDLQQKNRFKFLLTPTAEGLSSFSASSALGAGLSLQGNFVTTVYLQNITFPTGPTIEYEELTKRPKGLIRPESVILTFLEDEKGTVWKYLQTWRKSIVYVSPQKGSNPVVAAAKTIAGSNIEYVFANNQDASERIGILLMGTASKKGQKFPRIMFYGLKLKNIEDIVIGYTEQNNLTYSVNCTVREIAAPLI